MVVSSPTLNKLQEHTDSLKPMTDTDVLFQKHSVVELRSMLSKIKKDVEGKKTELRLMVGEKYRDIIDASDSIQKMRDASMDLKTLLEESQKYCNIKSLEQAVHAQQKLGSQSNSETQKKNDLFVVASHILFLILTPEEIWNALESAEFIKAAGIYRIAEAVFKNLQKTQDHVTLRSFFPLAFRQWDSIINFEVQIFESSIEYIKKGHEDVLEALSAILILDNKKNLTELMSLYLNLRLSWMDQTGLESENNVAKKLKDMIQKVFGTLYSTLEIFEMNHDTEKSSVSEKLLTFVQIKNADESTKKLVLLKWFSGSTLLDVIFPHITSSFSHMKSFDPVFFQPIKTNIIQQELDNWLSKAVSTLATVCHGILNDISTGEQLAKTRDQLLLDVIRLECSIKNQTGSEHLSSWSHIIQRAIGKDFSFWNNLLLEPFANRFNELARQKFQVAFKSLESSIKLRITENSFQDQNLPISFGDSQKSYLDCDKITPLISKLLAHFETSINVAISGLWHMLDFTEISSNILSMDELSLSETDRLAFSTIYCFDKSARDLIELMKKVLMENINHFKENCRIFLDEIISNLAKDEEQNRISKILFIGKLSKLFSEKMSLLVLSLDNFGVIEEKHLKEKEKNATNSSHFGASLLDLYQESYILSMKLEIDRFSIRLKKSIKYDAWDQDEKYTSIWSEHEIDNANGSKEIILLPRHASNFLMKFTLDLCERIHKMFLFDVDEDMLLTFTYQFGNAIETILRDVLAYIDVNSDKGRIQMLFDFLFLAKILEVSSSMEGAFHTERLEIKKTVNSHVSKLKTKIDPIDLTIYSTPLDASVHSFFVRHSLLLGPLIAFKTKAILSHMHLTLSESHQVLPFSQPVQRFPLLPIGVGINKNDNFSGSRRKKSDSKRLSKPIVKINILPSASSNMSNPKSNPDGVLSFVNMTGTGQARELFMNASTFLSGVLSGGPVQPVSSPSNNPKKKI